MSVIGISNLKNTTENRAYFEVEVAEAAQLKARTEAAAYYRSPTPARWISVGGTMAEDGAEIKEGEISAAFAGHAPKSFAAKNRKGRPVQTTAISNNLENPDRKAATDVTISLEKSVSTLLRAAELAGEKDLVRKLRQAEDDVAREVVRHAAEIGLIRTRRGHAGKDSEIPADFLVAMVPHALSRAGDPQEHRHLLVFNGSIRKDGTVGTLDLSELVSHKFYLQSVFSAGMANRLKELGFAVTYEGDKPRGKWEIAGAPAKLMKEWSQRRNKILETLKGVAGDFAHRQAGELEAAERDEQKATATDVASNVGRGKTQSRRELKKAISEQTRASKAELPSDAELEAKHRNDLAEHTNGTPADVVQAMRVATLRTPEPAGAALEAGVEYLFEKSSVATLRQLRTAVAEAASIRSLSVAQIEDEVQRGIASGLVRAIGTTERGDTVYSTDAAIATEWRMLTASVAGQGRGVLTVEGAERAIAEVEARERAAGRKDFTFSDEQRAFVKWFARGDAVVVGEGLAGTGKTTAMQTVVVAAHHMDLHTIGTAPTTSAAENLHKEAGTREHLPIQGLALQLRTGQRTLTERDYILIDEAGMAELGHAATVIQAARAAGAQVALVGDERQFAPIGAGSPFTSLGTVLGTSQLAEIRRQLVPWQNAASRAMASGDIDTGLMSYHAEGRWKFGKDREDTARAVITDWTADLDRPGKNGAPSTRLIIARQHEDAHALNAGARQVLIDRGMLGTDEVVVKTLHRDGNNGDLRDLPLRKGDELIVWRNVPKMNLNNGDRITVEKVEPIKGDAKGDVLLTWRTAKTGALTSAPLSSLTPPPGPDDPASQPRVPYLQHAYAVTQYSAQGKTVDKAFVYGGTGLDARSVYVSLTRHRDDVAIYWDKGGIAQSLREEGQAANHTAIVEHIRREASKLDKKHNVLDFVKDWRAWLATGDLHAETPRPTAVAAQMQAAAQSAATTVQATLANPRQAHAVIREAIKPRPPVAVPVLRVSADARAQSAYLREVRRQRTDATAANRRALRQLDPIVRDLRRSSGVTLAAGLSDAPDPSRDNLREAAARALPQIGEALAAWNHRQTASARASHLDARSEEFRLLQRSGLLTAAGPMRAAPTMPDQAAWTDTWLRHNRLGRYAPVTPLVLPAQVGRAALSSRLPPLPESLTKRLPDVALASLARPTLSRNPAAAPVVSAAAYAEILERERTATERRVLAGVVIRLGTPEKVARSQLADALTRPEAIRDDTLRLEVRRIKALTEARDTVVSAISGNWIRLTAPVRAIDPLAAAAEWRLELRRAQRSTEVHAPRPDPAADRVAFDGRGQVTVGEMVAMLQARRMAIGMPSGVIAPPASAAAQMDTAIATLREAVAAGRLSARSPIIAAPPSDQPAWLGAYRQATATAARQLSRNLTSPADPRSGSEIMVRLTTQRTILEQDLPRPTPEPVRPKPADPGPTPPTPTVNRPRYSGPSFGY